MIATFAPVLVRGVHGLASLGKKQEYGQAREDAAGQTTDPDLGVWRFIDAQGQGAAQKSDAAEDNDRGQLDQEAQKDDLQAD